MNNINKWKIYSSSISTWLILKNGNWQIHVKKIYGALSNMIRDRDICWGTRYFQSKYPQFNKYVWTHFETGTAFYIRGLPLRLIYAVTTSVSTILSPTTFGKLQRVIWHPWDIVTSYSDTTWPVPLGKCRKRPFETKLCRNLCSLWQLCWAIRQQYNLNTVECW